MRAAAKPSWSVVLIIALIGGCSPDPSSSKGAPNYQAYESVPTRSLWISVERSATKQFHDQLERFAQRNGMGIWKSITSPDQRNFSITIQGDRLQIIAVNDAELYEVAFYPRKAKSISDASLDAFVGDMKGDLGSIGGVTFPATAKRPSYSK